MSVATERAGHCFRDGSCTRKRAGILQRIVDHRADYLYILPALLVMLVVIAYPDLLHDRAELLQNAARTFR